jgi:hypothetical protein
MLTFMQLALRKWNSYVLHQKQLPSALSCVVVQDYSPVKKQAYRILLRKPASVGVTLLAGNNNVLREQEHAEIISHWRM